MEKTFQDSIPKNESERQNENAKRAEQGEPQIPGAAGRESVASKDPKGKATLVLCRIHPSRTHAQYVGGSILTMSDLMFTQTSQSSTPAAVPARKATSLSKSLPSKPSRHTRHFTAHWHHPWPLGFASV